MTSTVSPKSIANNRVQRLLFHKQDFHTDENSMSMVAVTYMYVVTELNQDTGGYIYGVAQDFYIMYVYACSWSMNFFGNRM